MGIAISSGVFDSLGISAKTLKSGFSNWESHTPGTQSPTGPPVPTRFVACVRREETAEKLRGTFDAMGELGQSVEILAGKNVEGVLSADVVLLW